MSVRLQHEGLAVPHSREELLVDGFDHDAEHAHLAELRSAAEASGLECFPVQDAGLAMAFAVPGETNEGVSISMVSFLIGSPGGVYVTAGVALQPVADRLAILEALNFSASDNPTFTPFVHGRDGDILVQTKLPAEAFLKFPALLGLLVGVLPDVVQRTRSTLRQSGIAGEFFGWSNENLGRLAGQSVM